MWTFLHEALIPTSTGCDALSVVRVLSSWLAVHCERCASSIQDTTTSHPCSDQCPCLARGEQQGVKVSGRVLQSLCE